MRPRTAAAIAMRAAGSTLKEIKDALGFTTEAAVSSAIQAGRGNLKAAGISDPIKEARNRVANKMLTPALDAYQETLNDATKPGLRLLAATNVLKGSQVFINKNESEETRRQIQENIETRRLEIAIERKLGDQFNLDCDPTEAVTAQLIGDET
jgi:hypothetical protein